MGKKEEDMRKITIALTALTLMLAVGLSAGC